MLFEEAAKRAIENRGFTKKYRNKKSFARWDQVYRIHILPFLKGKDINDIDSDDIADILKKIWIDHPHTGYVARMVLDHIFSYSIFKKWKSDRFNPAAWKGSMIFELPPISDVIELRHREAMTLEEAKYVYQHTHNSSKTIKKAVAFGLLTACRSSEYMKATWDEIDFENKLLLVPPSRCKVKRVEPFVVPLSTQAMDILNSLPRTNKYIFASNYNQTKPNAPIKPLNVSRILSTIRNIIPDHEGVTAHGSRSTFSTWCADNGKDPITRESCLMHVTDNKVAQAYNRSNNINAKRILLQEWADELSHT